MPQNAAREDEPRELHRFVRREPVVTLLVWLTVALAAASLRVLARRATGEVPTLGGASMDVWMIGLWAAATPLILRSARRFPVRSPRVAARALAHLAVGSGFVLATNVLIRLPMLGHGGWEALFAGTLLGVATYYPGAIISYGVIVAIGQRVFAPTVATPAPAPVVPDGDGARLVIREWNRVHLIEPDDIEWIEADDNYVVVHTSTRSYKGRERIGDIEARLDARRFVRVHRSAMVHIAKIREVQPLLRGDQAIVMHSGQVVRVARSRRQALEEALGVVL
jgi:LytTr DNA-binding domain